MRGHRLNDRWFGGRMRGSLPDLQGRHGAQQSERNPVGLLLEHPLHDGDALFDLWRLDALHLACLPKSLYLS